MFRTIFSSDLNCNENEFDKKEPVAVCDIFDKPPTMNYKFGAGAVRAEAASPWGSFRLRLHNTLLYRALFICCAGRAKISGLLIT
jgi:hypothetical protein